MQTSNYGDCKIINLNENPNAILEMKNGDHVTVLGQELICTVFQTIGETEQVYLTTADSKVSEYHKQSDDGQPRFLYSEMIKHLRKSDLSQAAMMTRQEMINIIATGAYSIN
jgi:aspartyl/asparaginyl-tRNA synthetase